MSNNSHFFKIKLETKAGGFVSSIINEAIKIAKDTKLEVEFKISGVQLNVNGNSDLNNVWREYENKISKE